MPRPVLQAVAALLVLGATGSFVMGVIHAPERGRMPGERSQGGPAAASVINATEATPLSEERIEGPPKVEEKPATNTDDTGDEDAADATATNATSATNATPLIKPPPPINVPAPATNAQPTNTTPSEDAPPF